MNTLKKCLDTTFRLRLALVLSLFIFLPEGHARFMVEPHWDFHSGKVRSGFINSSANYISEMQGVNLGYLGQYFMAGMVIQVGRISFEEDPEGDGNKYYKSGGIGTFLGFHFFDRWKLWTEYQNTNIEPKTNDDHRFFGQQATFGLGIRIYDGVMLNYKYYNNYFTQVETDEDGKTSSLDKNIRTNGSSFGLSFILVF